MIRRVEVTEPDNGGHSVLLKFDRLVSTVKKAVMLPTHQCTSGWYPSPLVAPFPLAGAGSQLR